MRPEDKVLSLLEVGDFTREGQKRIVRELAGLPLSEAVSLLLFAPPVERLEMVFRLCVLEKKDLEIK